jgi:formate hydrogenlyase subunit 6/NADH:ubiquinone oxidoreductase subunit I
MFWFLRGMRRGVVTTRYPAAPDASTERLPGPPSFRVDLIDNQLAERLAAACPAGALRRDGRDLVLDLGACTACGRCAEVGGAAVVEGHAFELAARNREELVKRIRIGAAA